MIRLRARELPGKAMAKALDYCLERREGLSRFLDDGRLEIDSNLVEQVYQLKSQTKPKRLKTK